MKNKIISAMLLSMSATMAVPGEAVYASEVQTDPAAVEEAAAEASLEIPETTEEETTVEEAPQEEVQVNPADATADVQVEPQENTEIAPLNLDAPITGDDTVTEAEKLAAEYTAYLLKQYGWGIDKVKKHQDFANKYCPHRTLDMGWQRFLDMVSSYLEDKPISNEKIESGSDEPVKTYQNGSTTEVVYADTACTKRIGSLDPRERCDCFGIFNDRAMVRYQVNGSSNYKMGFCKWLGGVK